MEEVAPPAYAQSTAQVLLSRAGDILARGLADGSRRLPNMPASQVLLTGAMAGQLQNLAYLLGESSRLAGESLDEGRRGDEVVAAVDRMEESVPERGDHGDPDLADAEYTSD